MLNVAELLNPSALGANTLTVGKGGRFAKLEDALAYRAQVAQPVLLLTTTGALAGTIGGTVDVRKFTLAAAIPGAWPNGTIIGIRVNGAGPILRARVGNAAGTAVFLERPSTQDFAGGTQIDIYSVPYAAILLLPGTDIVYTAVQNLTVPAYTVIGCPVRGQASIQKNNGQSSLFSSDATANEIYFANLRLSDGYMGINSNFFNANVGFSVHPLVPLARFALYNSDCVTESNDFFYCVANGGIGVDLRGNTLRGTYDVIRLGSVMHGHIETNIIVCESQKTMDGGEASGIAIGESAGFTAPSMNLFIGNNDIQARSLMIDNTFTRATGVDIRNNLPSAMNLIIQGNRITASIDADNTLTDTDGPQGIKVGTQVAGANTPNIVSQGNAFRIFKTGTGNPSTPLTMNSNAASYVIKSQGNVNFGGGVATVGTFVTPLAAF